MTASHLHSSVDPGELKSRFHEKKLAIETAIAVQKPHSEINQLYQELKIIQQELNLTNLQYELNKESEVKVEDQRFDRGEIRPDYSF